MRFFIHLLGEHRKTRKPLILLGLTHFFESQLTIIGLSIGDADNVNRYNAQFVRWAGDLEGLDVDVTSATITFVVDRPRRIAPIYSEQWLLYQTGGEWRIKNSVWDLAVEKYGTKKQIEAREKCMAQRARRT